jgi:hypothetical protein
MKRKNAQRLGLLACGLLITGLASPPGWAAPPPNDNRDDATVINPPAEIQGTLVDATTEPVNEGSTCASTDASVWYRFTAPNRGAVIITLDAGGEMDAVLDLYRRTRSRYGQVDCQPTDTAGRVTIDNSTLDPGGDYAIRVGKQLGSPAAGFTLQVLVPSPPPEPPGKPLPGKGVRNRVDRLLNPGDAYWMRMREGQTMRLSLRTRQCTRLEVYGPQTTDFDGETLRTLPCGGFGLFTPTQSGRHYLVVVATGKSRAEQPYRLRAAAAGRDDTTPGIFIGNNARMRGRVNGGIDFRDMYRFDVTRRSTLTLEVNGGPSMRLVSANGGRIGRGDYIERRVPAGRYFVAVEGDGAYTLRRVSRTITSANVRFNGRRAASVQPGTGVRVSLNVRPAVAGPGVMVVERFDPLEGWQFAKRFRVQVSNGQATVAYTPPSVGRYRVTGEFDGTRTAAPSYTGTARLNVQGPLVD